MKRKIPVTKFWVLLKGRQPKQDFGEGVHDVRNNKIWLSREGEVVLRHAAQLPGHLNYGGLAIQDHYARWLAPYLARQATARHELVRSDDLQNGMWSNTIESNGDQDYYTFPNQHLAQTHASIITDPERRSSLFNGLSQALERANLGGNGVITIHPHNYPNIMATRDTLRHEDTHQALNKVVPDWHNSLFGEGGDAERLLQDTDIRDAVRNLIPAYGSEPRTLHNELLARIGNRDGLRHLRLDPDSDKYLRTISKVLDKGVAHHGQDFYRLFEHSAPIFKQTIWRHVAGNQSHPNYGLGVADVRRGQITLTHDGVIGLRHIGGVSIDGNGNLPPDHVPNVLARFLKERDAVPYRTHREPVEYSRGSGSSYAIAPVTAAKPERHAQNFIAPVSMAKRHIALVENPDLKRDLFHGLHSALIAGINQRTNGDAKFILPIGMPDYQREQMEKALKINNQKQFEATVYALHPDWSPEAKRRLKLLLDAHKKQGSDGLKRAWEQMLREGVEDK